MDTVQEKRIPWTEGGGSIVAAFTGRGDAPLAFSSDREATGLDRQQLVSVATATGPGLSVTVVVRQEGLREEFLTRDGGTLLTRGDAGEAFAVLKQKS